MRDYKVIMPRSGDQLFKKKYVLFCLIALFLIVKLPILFSFFPQYRESDELAIGAIGKVILEGPVMPIFDYQYTASESGNLLITVPIMASFMLFGCSLFSLKLVALFSGLTILTLLYVFLNRNFNRRIAVFSSLFFILSPQIFTERSFMVQGTHFEPIIFSILAIFIFYEIFLNHKTHNRYFALFGLTSGFGVYFSYSFLITFATCFLFWFAFDSRFFLKKSFLIFTIFFICGFSPWIYYYLFYSRENLMLHGIPLYHHFLNDHIINIFVNLKNILIHDIFHFFRPNKFGMFWNFSIAGIYYSIALYSFSILIWLNRRTILLIITKFTPAPQRKKLLSNSKLKELFFLAYPVIFCLIYSISDFRYWVHDDSKGYWAYRYFMPLFPFVCIIISIFLDKIWNRRNSRPSIFVIILFISLVISGFLSNIGLISFKDFGKIQKQDGYSYNELGCLIGENNSDGLRINTEIVDRFYQNYKTFTVYEGVGLRIGLYSDIDLFNEALTKLKKQYWPFCYYGIGKSFADKYENNNTDGMKFDQALNEIYKQYWPYFIEGLGVGLWLFDEEEIDIYRLNKWVDRVPNGYQYYFYRGVIYSSFSSESGYDIDMALKIINVLPQEHVSYYYEGLGAAIGGIFGSDLEECDRLINRVDEKYRPYCYKGLAAELGGKRVYML